MIHEGTGKTYYYHEKHKAWVIQRDIAQVHCTGGSWFESTHYKTEEELVVALDAQAALDKANLRDRLFDGIDQKLLDKFKVHNKKNPHIYELFERFTKEAARSGREYYSHWAIAQRIRWYTDIETVGCSFKLSNDFIAIYARLVVYRNPKLEGFFKFKKMKEERTEPMGFDY